MPPTSPTGEEVVEKKASAPVSTACLIIACAALLGGIIFQVLEIAEYRSGSADPKDQAAKRYKADIKKLKDAVEETLAKTAVGAVAPEDTPPGAVPPGPGDTAPADGAEGADAKAPPTGGDAKEEAPDSPSDPAPSDAAPEVAPAEEK